MRIKKTNAITGFAIAVGVLFLTYFVLYTCNEGYEDSQILQDDLSRLESKIRDLEGELDRNQLAVVKLRETAMDMLKKQGVIREESKAIRAKGKSPVNKTFASIHKMDAIFAQTNPSQCDIRMSDVYDKLSFDNPDGGVWKQGWDIKIDENRWNSKNKLRVFVVPHSHNDPGWIKTFDEYYQAQTRLILDNMVVKLQEHPDMKFIWAEVSYFAMWWGTQPLDLQQRVKTLLKNGQLEIVTGGWVMTDEANSYYYAILEQLILGHEWLKLNLDYKPNSGWAIDPFGMTSTMAYVLKRIGLEGMLIQRTHYSVKKQLAKEKSLEFLWRQHWDHEDTTDMLTHMMPFYSYDVPHTCGPDPKVCCQFDFRRLPGGPITCPWRIPPQPITEKNVAERSAVLLDQYRKKAELYKTNVLLIPLGDDFRYEKSSEWDEQYRNYKRIFDYVNSQPEMNAILSFGTLADYFTEIRKSSAQETQSETSFFPTLSGDFFTYADRDDHYWSGYYTSRPFYKNMDRVLEGYMRAAEIMYSMMWAQMEYVGSDAPELAEPLMEYLVTARQNLALFQHHDGVTGTAKNHVMDDYGNRMLESISKLQTVMSHSTHYLLTSSKAFYKPSLNSVWFDLDEFRENHYSLPKKTVIDIGHPDEPSRVVIFNSHARRRSEIVTLKINLSSVKVYKINNIEGDEEEEIVPSQISPVFDDQGQISNNEFYISFLTQAKGMALQSYFIQQLRPDDGSISDIDFAHIRIHNSAKHPFQVAPFEDPEVFEVGEAFSLQNGYVKAEFSSDGMLQSLTTLDDRLKTNVNLEFISYGTRHSGDKSGAYLFLPDGKAKLLPIEKPYVRIIEGKILSYVEVFLPFVKHVVTLKSSPGADGTGIQIDNNIDIRKYDNTEIAMRLKTDLKTNDIFFTDLNGFQMMKRKRYSKLPIQGNYYPIPSMAYIQDETSRLTLVSRQPLGGSSLNPGELEIMMDRRLMQDDNRGLFQGVTDNHVTPHNFFLILERKTRGCKDEADDVAASYPSLLALAVRHNIINPIYRLIFAGEKAIGSSLAKSYTPMDKDLACDIHVVNLRTMLKTQYKMEPGDNAALILHREGFNSCFKPVGLTCSTNEGKISLEELFPELYSDSVRQMSLSLLYDGLKVEKGFTVSIKPMEMYSFLLRR